MVILECEEAFENTKLSPLNVEAHLPGGRGELRTPESLHARRVRCSAGMGLPLLNQPPHLLDQLLLH
jgi:hypothetical protein